MKKVAALGMATALSLSMAAPAFAADTNPNEKSTVLSGETKPVTVDVTVDATGAVVLNPYKMVVAEAGLAANSLKFNDQIISKAKSITNNSAVPLQLDVTVTGTAKGELKFAKAPWSKDYTGAQEDGKAPTDKSVAAWLAISDTENGFTKVYNKDTMPYITGAASKPMENVKTLEDKDAKQNKNVCYYKVIGESVAAPKGATWTAADTFDVAIAWTFTPLTGTATISETKTIDVKSFTFAEDTAGTAEAAASFDEDNDKFKVEFTKGTKDSAVAENDEVQIVLTAPNGGAVAVTDTGKKLSEATADLKDAVTLTYTYDGSSWECSDMTGKVVVFWDKTAESDDTGDEYDFDAINYTAAT